MISLVLQPVRVQAALAGLLGLVAALLCGWWLAAFGGSGALQRNTFGPRALPKLATGSDRTEILQQEKSGWEARRQSSESQTKTQSEELARLTEAAKNLQLILDQSGAMTPEEKSVVDLKKKGIEWDLLKREKTSKPEFDHLIEIWENPTDATEQEALRILAANRSHWEKEASTAATNAADLRKEQALKLQTMKTTFDAESGKKLASLRDETIRPAVTDKILEAVKMLFSGDTRASPGENFINSAGIELVWVPEGNFWIGKTEVTGKQYNFVINGAAEGSEEPMDGVSVARARQYCDLLNQREGANAEALEVDTNRYKPEDFDYALPSVAEWRLGKKSKESLLTGLDTEPYEWTSNQHGDGIGSTFPQSGFILKQVGSNYPVVIHGNSLVTLEPNTTSSISAGTGGRTKAYWTHQLGFRVLLIRK
jgi:formylglycine-generating enzyme required for sulfatase activity